MSHRNVNCGKCMNSNSLDSNFVVTVGVLCRKPRKIQYNSVYKIDGKCFRILIDANSQRICHDWEEVGRSHRSTNNLHANYIVVLSVE